MFNRDFRIQNDIVYFNLGPNCSLILAKLEITYALMYADQSTIDFITILRLLTNSLLIMENYHQLILSLA